MRLQVGLGGKGPVAYGTAVRSVAGVAPGVLLQRSLVVETLVTLPALEALPLGVDECVAPQMFLPPVGLPAEFTGVGLESGVHLGVGSQGVRGGEQFVAQPTGEFPAHVCFCMFDEVFALGEGFEAGFALVTLFVSCNIKIFTTEKCTRLIFC